MEFDPGVVGIGSQPFWLHWHDGERERRHALDCFIHHADGSAVVVDIRADERIEPKDAEAFEVTRLLCVQPTRRWTPSSAVSPPLPSLTTACPLRRITEAAFHAPSIGGVAFTPAVLPGP
ncbi:hypothetical protein ACFU8Q_37030 [Streptomyces sp. NPDC057543]|uniref:hypothetical protein n=1 Tax=Streptomyces sp. NPDC057543 TaxID=3346163 RepID=UPI0036817A57